MLECGDVLAAKKMHIEHKQVVFPPHFRSNTEEFVHYFKNEFEKRRDTDLRPS